MKRIKLNNKQLQALLQYYKVHGRGETAVNHDITSSATYKTDEGLLVAVVFFGPNQEVKQAFIPDYVEKNCPFFASAPRAAAGVNSHGTG